MTLLPGVQVRRLGGTDAPEVVDAVFAGLSAESRRLRFHIPMPRLPGYFRHHLGLVDGANRTAVGAWLGAEPIGIGRLIRITSTRAEASIAVVDAWQRRGIGRRLLRELCRTAVDLGYREITADVLAENTAMLRLLDQEFPDAQRRAARGVIHVVCPLAVPVPAQVSVRTLDVARPSLLLAAIGGG